MEHRTLRPWYNLTENELFIMARLEGDRMGFRRLFWGVLFLFTFRINGFDILPDVIGYLFIAVGLNDLHSRSRTFATGRTLAFVAAVLAIFTVIQSPQPGLFISTLNLGLLVVELLLFFQICTGISELARSRNEHALADTAMSRWRWFLGLNLVALALTLFGVFIPVLVLSILPVFLIALTIAMFVILALMMGLMSRADQALN